MHGILSDDGQNKSSGRDGCYCCNDAAAVWGLTLEGGCGGRPSRSAVGRAAPAFAKHGTPPRARFSSSSPIFPLSLPRRRRRRHCQPCEEPRMRKALGWCREESMLPVVAGFAQFVASARLRNGSCLQHRRSDQAMRLYRTARPSARYHYSSSLLTVRAVEKLSAKRKRERERRVLTHGPPSSSFECFFT